MQAAFFVLAKKLFALRNTLEFHSVECAQKFGPMLRLVVVVVCVSVCACMRMCVVCVGECVCVCVWCVWESVCV